MMNHRLAAAKLDAVHEDARVAVVNLCSIAETALDMGDVDGARYCLAEIAKHEATMTSIEACWIPKAAA